MCSNSALSWPSGPRGEVDYRGVPGMHRRVDRWMCPPHTSHQARIDALNPKVQFVDAFKHVPGRHDVVYLGLCQYVSELFTAQSCIDGDHRNAEPSSSPPGSQ